MSAEDLSWMPDDEIYALEQQRMLEPRALDEIAAELRRRRRSRRAALADLPSTPVDAPTLGDIERIAGSLEKTIEARFTAADTRLRRLRWWVFVVPLIWTIIGVATWVFLREWAPHVLQDIVGLP